MKKFLALGLLALITLTATAQHMKFMGIPLNGTISEFTTKLQAKGITISPFNKSSGSGCRYFTGTFFGKEAECIFVYYIPTTKLVYRAKVVFKDEDLDLLKITYKQISESLKNKYLSLYEEGTENGYEAISYKVDLGVRSDIYEGYIDLFFSDNESSYPKTYYLSVDYYDTVNFSKYKDTIEDDL